jgi:hypothetical protein
MTRRTQTLAEYSSAFPMEILSGQVVEKYVQTAPLMVDDIVTRIKESGGNSPDVLSAARGFTKDELENTASDLLMIAVSHHLAALTGVLLEKGLRSGHALDAAVHLRDIGTVNRLLNAGVNPSESAEAIANRLREPAIAQAIATQRDENRWYNFRPEF